jgi:hypothetical protein
MDETKVKSIQAPYSPLLSPTQIDEISRRIGGLSELEKAEAIVQVSKAMLIEREKSEAPKPAHQKSRRS